jgi:cell division septum initiation protein DivIVA
MDTFDWPEFFLPLGAMLILVIPVVAAAIVSIRRSGEVKRDVGEVHTLVNKNYTEQTEIIASLRKELGSLNAARLRDAQRAEPLTPGAAAAAATKLVADAAAAAAKLIADAARAAESTARPAAAPPLDTIHVPLDPDAESVTVDLVPAGDEAVDSLEVTKTDRDRDGERHAPTD